MVMRPIIMPVSRCECSANIDRFSSQPAGLMEPLESGQSGKAMPAPMLVVNAPSVTSRNTHALPTAAKIASAGLCEEVRWEVGAAAMSEANDQQKGGCCLPQ